ncbi:MAG: efflux RND transporter periplasmic adaptor subunit [Selenomonadaceae bacterium]|nr:efflux RND transporter periplasmic adaptor subunit [Selenomonadaceae bacterium]MBQ6132289.1 efflux RND transporter periplasmic adaptor subunit [Selenomonadaceae bacterium]MBQ7493691.1 efflux RND transporter periplasmic adaptor subunit [Selenomonadaceae bacterium]
MKWKIFIVAVILIGAAVGYKFYTDKVVAETTKTYETEKVVRMDLIKTVSATGTVQPRDSVEVSGKVTARIKDILVEENDHVTEGQVVAILDGKDFEAKLDQANFTLTNAKQKLDRTERLYKIGAKSLEELQDAQYQYDRAKSEVELAQDDVNQTVITAPMDGVVVGEPKTPGTMAVQGSTNPTVIMRIADLSEKLVKAKVDETDIGSVRVGEPATFTVDAYPEKTFRAEVTKISQTDTTNSWDTSSSTTSSSSNSSNAVIYYYVTFAAPDEENLLLPAMTARLDIVVGQVRDALCVPIDALKTDAKGSYVERITKDAQGKDVVEKVYITVGLYGEEFVEVTGGNLNPGDDVSTTYEAAEKKTTQGGGMGGMRRPPF